MLTAGLDTGDTNGLVIVNEAGNVVEHLASTDPAEVYAALDCHAVGIVVLEQAPKTQYQYNIFKFGLTLYGYKVFEVSPGSWKPNPHCRTPKAEQPEWTQHERDALSLIKFHYLLATGRSWHQRANLEG